MTHPEDIRSYNTEKKKVEVDKYQPGLVILCVIKMHFTTFLQNPYLKSPDESQAFKVKLGASKPLVDWIPLQTSAEKQTMCQTPTLSAAVLLYTVSLWVPWIWKPSEMLFMETRTQPFAVVWDAIKWLFFFTAYTLTIFYPCDLSMLFKKISTHT